MDYDKYEKLKEMYLCTWEELITRMPLQDKPSICLTNEYSASVSVWSSGFSISDKSYILRLHHYNNVVFSMSFNTSTQYLSTFDDTGIRIAKWKSDHPRYYALHDPSNAKDGQTHTFIQYPFPEEYFFQRMTVQETLPEEDYKLWDDVCELQRAVLIDHPSQTIAMVLNDFDLTPQRVLELLVPYLKHNQFGDPINVT
jgi:hypothetical protein